MYTCKYCNKEFEKASSMACHVSHCKMNPDKKRNEDTYKDNAKKSAETLKLKTLLYRSLHPYKYELKEFTCNCLKCNKEYTITTTQELFDKGKYKKNCSRSCANSRVLTDETKQAISNGVKNSETFLKNCLRSYITYYCKLCGKAFKMNDDRDITGRTYCCLECKHLYLSLHTGGYRKGSGHGKSGWYKGFWCDSTWELAFVMYYLDNNLCILRCKESRQYIYKDKVHTYHPDFITDKGTIEIKGYNTDLWIAKQQLNQDVIVLYKNDMKFYLDYAKLKYGCQLELLYDNSNPSKSIKEFAWVNNGIDQKFIHGYEYDQYIQNGWKRGRLH